MFDFITVTLHDTLKKTITLQILHTTRTPLSSKIPKDVNI